VSEGSQSGFVNGRTRLEVYVLREQAEAHAARTHNVASIRRLFAADEAKNRSLASAVASYEADVLARINLQGCAAQDVLRAIGFVNVGEPK
jgi:hypothetical protein